MYIRATENAGTITAYMSSADYKQLMEHARIGALVSKMPIGLELSPGPHGSWWCAGDGPYHTPVQALLSAGITEDN